MTCINWPYGIPAPAPKALKQAVDSDDDDDRADSADAENDNDDDKENKPVNLSKLPKAHADAIVAAFAKRDEDCGKIRIVPQADILDRSGERPATVVLACASPTHSQSRRRRSCASLH